MEICGAICRLFALNQNLLSVSACDVLKSLFSSPQQQVGTSALVKLLKVSTLFTSVMCLQFVFVVLILLVVGYPTSLLRSKQKLTHNPQIFKFMLVFKVLNCQLATSNGSWQ